MADVADVLPRCGAVLGDGRVRHELLGLIDTTLFPVTLGSMARNEVLQLSLLATGQIVTHHVISNVDPRDARR